MGNCLAMVICNVKYGKFALLVLLFRWFASIILADGPEKCEGVV